MEFIERPKGIVTSLQIEGVLEFIWWLQKAIVDKEGRCPSQGQGIDHEEGICHLTTSGTGWLNR